MAIAFVRSPRPWWSIEDIEANKPFAGEPESMVAWTLGLRCFVAERSILVTNEGIGINYHAITSLEYRRTVSNLAGKSH